MLSLHCCPSRYFWNQCYIWRVSKVYWTLFSPAIWIWQLRGWENGDKINGQVKRFDPAAVKYRLAHSEPSFGTQCSLLIADDHPPKQSNHAGPLQPFTLRTQIGRILNARSAYWVYFSEIYNWPDELNRPAVISDGCHCHCHCAPK